jgi:TPR repeat protein
LPKPTTEKRAEQLLLLEKGKESLGHGNILIARQFFERAANNGLAEAAFALAATYDPRELSRMAGGATVPPEPAVAVKWYERARELGSLDAAARLSGLARR